MQGRLQNEPVERGRRRPNTRAVIALLCAIAVASAIGIVISLGQRAAAPVAQHVPAPFQPLPVTPPPVPDTPQSGAGFSVADDPATHQVVLFGGVGDYPNTWLWNGSSWTQASPPTSPAGRFGASAAYDPETKEVLLFGGRVEDGTPVHDTWAWNGVTWQDLDSGADGPPPGAGSDMAWDAATTQMVLVTSSGVISSPAETWIWAGNRWSRPADADLAAGADYSPMWYDPVSRSLLAVGCCVGPPPSTGAANTTWQWTGHTWTLLPVAAGAPVNASTMALDPVAGRLVLCACDGPGNAVAELFVWGGSAWAPRPATKLPLQGGTEVTDSDHHVLLLFAAPPATSQFGEMPVEVWALTGSTWHEVGSTA